jgi:4'-phosphopantetheinyl transferase
MSLPVSMSWLLPLPEPHAEVRVWRASLDLPDELLGQLRPCLSEDERTRAERFYFERDQGRFVVARATLRSALGSHLGIEPAAVGFVYGPHGKPSLAPPLDQTDWRFNVSHSGGTALIALAQGCEVGVDVEQIRAVPDAEKIAERCFSRRERATMATQPAAGRDKAFLRCWTRKEAYLKGTGFGITEPLQRIEIIPASDQDSIRCEVFEASRRRRDWAVYDVDAGERLIAALAICEGSP